MEDSNLVLIEWVSATTPKGGWERRTLRRVVRCASVGWLVESQDGIKTLVPHFRDIEADPLSAGAIDIPILDITREVQLTAAPPPQSPHGPPSALP